jgi:triosephosphate isomerase
MSKNFLVVGNWKMNNDVHQASLLVDRLDQHIETHKNVEVVLAPSMLVLQPISVQLNRRKFRLCAQDAYSKDEGAYTGEISFTMLHDLVHYCIVGHSERRLYFDESLELIRDKVAAAVRNKITPILCIGETHSERVDGETNQVIHDQLTSAIHNLTAGEVADIVVAYEPVWAISTFGGGVAKPDEIEKVIKFIRYQIKHLHSEKVAQKVRILYGGSVDDNTVGGYLSIEGCDGVLVGGASLNYKKFSGIVESAYKISKEENGGKKK